MTSFRFVHTADIHLDSPLRGLAYQEGSAADSIRTATREAFDNLVGQALREEVDFVVIAGDLYDGDWRDFQTGLFFVSQMGRLAAAEIPVFLLYGNHDAESQITRRLALPPNVKSFSERKPETFTLQEQRVALHGQSYRQRDTSHNLVPAYPKPIDGMFNIGVLHTGLGGMGDHANYAPCSLDDLVNKGYDYWALGHVHKAAILHERPHVAFPGNLQGRHIRETGAKGAYFVTIRDGELAEVHFNPCDVVRWAQVSVPLDGSTRMAEAEDRMRTAIENAVAQDSAGRLLACRVELTGQTDVHGSLLGSTEPLLAAAQSAALGLGEAAAWIERIVVSTQPTLDSATLRARKDALGELQRLLEDAGDDTTLMRQLESDIGELARRLPHELRTGTEDTVLKAAIDGNFADLIEQVSGYLTARVSADGHQP